jgi:multidrug transporter EmrE-like cation transporter
MGYALVLALVFRVLMDVFFKLSVRNANFQTIKGVFGGFRPVVSSWAFWMAMVASAINFWLWMMVLSVYDLSYAYPLSGVCFAFVMLCGNLFFGEKLDKYKLIGIGFILLSSLVLILE